MDEEKDVLSDEVIAEQEKEAEADSAKLEERIIAELGITDEQVQELKDKGLFDKFVEREGNLRKGFGTLLGNYKKLKGTKKSDTIQPVAQKPGEQQGLKPEDIRREAVATTRAQLDEEFLEESDYSDDIKELIRQEAKRNNTSARKAAKSEFVLFKIDQAKRAKAIDDAAKNGPRRSTTAKEIDPSKPLDPTEYDLSTEEGRKLWNEAKKAHAQARKK